MALPRIKDGDIILRDVVVNNNDGSKFFARKNYPRSEKNNPMFRAVWDDKNTSGRWVAKAESKIGVICFVNENEDVHKDHTEFRVIKALDKYCFVEAVCGDKNIVFDEFDGVDIQTQPVRPSDVMAATLRPEVKIVGKRDGKSYLLVHPTRNGDDLICVRKEASRLRGYLDDEELVLEDVLIVDGEVLKGFEQRALPTELVSLLKEV